KQNPWAALQVFACRLCGMSRDPSCFFRLADAAGGGRVGGPKGARKQ
ncbi:hypothetical protein HMPREF0322_02314, partial [Desulfitobacterium hafniense DP7]